MKNRKVLHRKGLSLTPREEQAFRRGRLLSWDDTLKQFARISRRGSALELRLDPGGELFVDPAGDGDACKCYMLFWNGGLFSRLGGKIRCSAPNYPSIHIVQQGRRILISGPGGLYYFGSKKRPLGKFMDLALVFAHEGKIFVLVADGSINSKVVKISAKDSRDAWTLAALSFLQVVEIHSLEKSRLAKNWLFEEGGVDHD